MAPRATVWRGCGGDQSQQMAAGKLTVGHCEFLNITLNLVWTSPGITGVKIMGILTELKGPISPSVTCVRRVPWGQNVDIMVFLREFPTNPTIATTARMGGNRAMSWGCPFGHTLVLALRLAPLWGTHCHGVPTEWGLGDSLKQ